MEAVFPKIEGEFYQDVSLRGQKREESCVLHATNYL